METAGPIIALDLVRVLKKCTAPNEKMDCSYEKFSKIEGLTKFFSQPKADQA
jgi:hypothetical protein